MSLDESYDLGLPHGHAGVLYFLGKCYQENILKDRCRKLIEGGIDFLLHHEQNFLQVGSFFPNAVTKGRQNNIIYPHKSRLAWCYGDLTILYTLLTLSQQLGRTELTSKCISMIITTSQRTDPGNNEVKDGFFCHGASGVGYVYKKIARLVNNRSIYETSEYWRQLCMQFEMNKFTTGSHKSGLLEGLGGVALFLIDHAHSSTGTDWDECIFL
jgi:lantibiotic modifying enzyme